MLSGILNIKKEKGYTSHDVVAIVRKTLGRIKTGHTGTLDPDATGVLPICVGKATKIADYIMQGGKTYQAQLRLGVETDTQDMAGTVIAQKPVTVSWEKIEEAVMSFKGECHQLPPMYSAIKVDGKKLYQLARQGKEIPRKTRLVHFYDIRILSFKPPDLLTIEVDCSKGAYIRTLCKDIGDKLGCGGAMDDLIRTKTSFFDIKNSFTLDEIKELAQQNKIEEILIPIDKILSDYPKVFVLEKGYKLLYNGNPLTVDLLQNLPHIDEGESVLVYDSDNTLIGIYQFDVKEKTGLLKPQTMLWEKQDARSL